MTVAEYYSNKVKNVLDGREDCRELINLQKRAFTQACNSIKIKDSTCQFSPDDKSTKADEIVVGQWYYGMVVKRLVSGTVDVTLFFDQYGKATCAYTGILNGSDSMSKVSALLKITERLRVAMNEAMEQLVKEVTNSGKEADDKACFVGWKQSDTCFVFGAVRPKFDKSKLRYVACFKTIDLTKYSDQMIADVLSRYHDSVDKLKPVFKEYTNQIIAQVLFRQSFLSDMDFQSELYANEDAAKRALKEKMKELLLAEEVSKEPEWTDDDKQCMIHKISDTNFYYGEVREETRFNGLCYVICAKQINLDNYSEEGIEDIVKSFYPGGIAEVKETYKDQANQILAECIFEMTQTSEMDYVRGLYRKCDDAAKELAAFAKIEAERFKVMNK